MYLYIAPPVMTTLSVWEEIHEGWVNINPAVNNFDLKYSLGFYFKKEYINLTSTQLNLNLKLLNSVLATFALRRLGLPGNFCRDF